MIVIIGSGWLTSYLMQRLAGSLLHFIWQGAVIAMITAITLRLLANRSADLRYSIAVTAILAMLVCPIATFTFYAQTGEGTRQILQLLTNRLEISVQSATWAATTATWTQWIVL